MSNNNKLRHFEKKLLHYTGKAISDFKMISHGDRVMVCLSGGKDSHAMLDILLKLKLKAKIKFSIHCYTLDQGQPGWDDAALRDYLDSLKIPYSIINKDTYTIVKDKTPEGGTYCSLCSRLRRGIIYNFARENNCNKIALGHHRDDLIQSLLMSIFYNGSIKSMPPKLVTDSKDLVLIRPLVYCQEQDIAQYAKIKQFPIIPCNLCNNLENLSRKKVAKLIKDLAQDNPKIPSNILNALQSIHPSQLMDKKLWNFKELEAEV